MTDQRKNELQEIYLKSDNLKPDDLIGLDLQEIIYIYFSINMKIKNGIKDENDDEILLTVFKAILARIALSDELYVAYNLVTNYPHIDEKGSAWIFSTEEYAQQAVAHYMQQMITLKIKKIEKEEFISEFYQFYRLGIGRLLVDNGYYNVIVYRKDLLSEAVSEDTPKDESPLINPELNLAMISFFQNFYSTSFYNGKQEFLKKLESNMIDCIPSARLLVPVKLEGRMLKSGEISKIDPSEKMQMAYITNEKDNTRWVPAFTDWDEFVKMYSRTEWKAAVVGYRDLMKMSDKCDGVLINFSGVPLRIDKENRKIINECAKVKS